MTEYHSDATSLAERLVAATGGNIVLGMPLGLGKANLTANALVERALADPSISLTILTALSLEKPRPGSDIERRFIAPVIDRLFGAYPDLAWVGPLRAGTLPDNIRIVEFFFLAGRWLAVPAAQQNYISVNYTHALGTIIDHKPNVLAQIVARRETPDGARLSMSCNPDLTGDFLKARDAGKIDPLIVCEVNDNLPFMGGDAELPESEADHVLLGANWPLFGPPREPVSLTDYAVGLNIARLVPDGGTLQIGIGSIGDAVAAGLIMRHRDGGTFRAALSALEQGSHPVPCHDGPFDEGLFGSSEMFVPAFLDLIDAGVLKRDVDGAFLQAGFFLGPVGFYTHLRDMSDAERARIAMKPVSYVNELYGAEEEKRRARKDARFVNSAMMATLLGAVVSDALEDGRVVSGVGGQYNFVAQAFALEGARVILALHATREDTGGAQSNIRWSYGHTTIPRHLRDVIVTEYGVADLRGRSDADVIAAMLAITDSRFQDELLDTAKRSGKIAADYRIPDRHRRNLPERIEEALARHAAEGHLAAFPFGSEFTPVEQRLIPALTLMRSQASSPLGLLALARAGLSGAPVALEEEAMARMGLDAPRSWRERLSGAVLRGALRRSRPLPAKAD